MSAGFPADVQYLSTQYLPKSSINIHSVEVLAEYKMKTRA